MIHYTITQGTEIVGVIEAGKREYAELQINTGQVLHDGRYPPREYTYDLTEFTQKQEIASLPLINRGAREIIVQALNQLSRQGFGIPFDTSTIKSKSHAKKLIDQAAGRARFRLVSEGVFIDQEYIIAEQQIAKWRLDGSNASELPECLSQAWLTASNQTAEQAATDLETMAQAWKSTLMQIRALRLTGKAAVNAATNEYKAVALGYIEQLDAIVAS